MAARSSATSQSAAVSSSRSVFYTMEDFKASFNLFCAVCGIGSLAMPSNYARAGPLYASIALGFMILANMYATLKLSRVMLVAPSSVKTYGDLGEWALGKWGRFFTVVSQMGVCLLSPIVFLVLGSTLLDVLFPDSFSQTFWIIFMALMVVPVCLIPTLKESAGMAFAGCMGTIIADIVAVSVLQYNMRGHPSIPSPDVSLHQVLTCFGNLALAYGAAPVVPDLQREHSQPQRMPRVVVVTILAASAFFVAIALAGYTAGGCQLSGNILYSIVSTSNPMGVAPLGFTTDRGAVVMAYLFMHVHISIAFSTLMQPPFYMAERLILGMHPAPQIVRFSKDAQVDVDLEQDLQESKPYVQCSTPIEHEVSTSSIVEKTEGQVSHLLTEEQLAAPYEGAKNKLRYITLRLCIIVVLVIIAVLAQNKFLNLEDFTGATAHTTSCLLMPLIIYLRVFWKSMSVYDKAASMIVIVVCAFTGCYVMIHAAEELFTPSDDDTLFPYCETELQNTPYYVYNNSTKKMVSAAGVLLWTTHSLLREHNWAAQGSEGDNERLQQVETFSEDVNLLPAQIYALPNTKNEVHVRGLVVGTKLYLHFVSDEKSVRLILSISEYVKAREAHVEEDLKSVLVVDGWRCNVEILRWRLERNLFPEFSSETNLVASDAELCRLPPPLLVCVGGFLTAPELCRVTQTGKYLLQLQDTPELWRQFLLRDYPTSRPVGDLKALYKSQWSYQRRMEAWEQHDRERGRRLHDYILRQHLHWRWHSAGRLPAPPLHLPTPPPFLPLHEEPWALQPPNRPDLLIDEDLYLLRDPFGYYRDPLDPYFRQLF